MGNLLSPYFRHECISMTALYLLQSVALWFVLYRMIRCGLHMSRWREFFLLLGWFAYSVASLGINEPWLYLGVWAMGAPAIAKAARSCWWLVSVLSLLAAALLTMPIVAQWGAGSFLAWYWLGAVTGAVLFAAGIRKNSPDLLLSMAGCFFIFYFLGMGGIAGTGFKGVLWFVVAGSSLVWIVMAWTIAPLQGEGARQADAELAELEQQAVLEATAERRGL